MKTGVWGLGSIGLRHARNIMALGYAVYGFDPDESRASLFSDIGGQPFKTEEEFLSTVDAVIICTPNHIHKNNIKKAIENNCSALIEKPIANTLDELEDLAQQANKKKLLLAPAMNMRFDAVVQQGQLFIKENKLGKPIWANFVCNAYLPEWRPGQDYKKGYTNNPKTGGVIFDIIHEFDMAFFLFNQMEVQSAFATNSNTLGIDSEDIADIILKSDEHNALIHIHLDYISKHNQRFFEIQFENGYIKADLITREVFVMNHITNLEETIIIKQSDNTCYEDELSNFISAIEGKQNYICSFHDAIAVLKNVVDARKVANLPC